MIANRSLASAYFAYERAYRLRELTAHAQMASFSFDVFTGDLIRSLLAGAKLVLCPIETVIDPAALHDLMLAEGIDAAEFVPATASLLFEYAEREGQDARAHAAGRRVQRGVAKRQVHLLQGTVRAADPPDQRVRADRGHDRQHLVRALGRAILVPGRFGAP